MMRSYLGIIILLSGAWLTGTGQCSLPWDDTLVDLFGQLSSGAHYDVSLEDDPEEDQQPRTIPQPSRVRGTAMPPMAKLDGAQQAPLSEQDKQDILKHLFGASRGKDPSERQVSGRLIDDIIGRFNAIQRVPPSTIKDAVNAYTHGQFGQIEYHAVRHFLVSYARRGWLCLDEKGSCILSPKGLFGLEELKKVITDDRPQKKKKIIAAVKNADSAKAHNVEDIVRKYTDPKPYHNILTILAEASLTEDDLKNIMRAQQLPVSGLAQYLNALAKNKFVIKDLFSFKYSITAEGRQAIPAFQSRLEDIHQGSKGPVVVNDTDNAPPVDIQRLSQPQIHICILRQVQEQPGIGKKDLIEAVIEKMKDEGIELNRPNLENAYLKKHIQTFKWLKLSKAKGLAYLSLTEAGTDHLHKLEALPVTKLVVKKGKFKKREDRDAEGAAHVSDSRPAKQSKGDVN